MDGTAGTLPEIAARLRHALETADLEALGSLLADSTTWGAPNDPHPPCRTRKQVLSWYGRERDAGTRAEIIELAVEGDAIVVGLLVRKKTGTASGEEDDERWQVYAVKDGMISRIVGYPTRQEALSRARGD